MATANDGTPAKSRPGRRWAKSADLLAQGKLKLRPAKSGQTPQQLVYTKLREMILNSKLQPGEWLRQEQLASFRRQPHTYSRGPAHAEPGTPG